MYYIDCKLFSPSNIVVLQFLQALISSVWTFKIFLPNEMDWSQLNCAPSIARRPWLVFHNEIEVQIQKTLLRNMCSKLLYSDADVVKIIVYRTVLKHLAKLYFLSVQPFVRKQKGYPHSTICPFHWRLIDRALNVHTQSFARPPVQFTRAQKRLV